MDDGAAALDELINEGTGGYTAWQDSQAPPEEEVEEVEEEEERHADDEDDEGMAEPGDDEGFCEDAEEEEEEEVEAEEEEEEEVPRAKGRGKRKGAATMKKSGSRGKKWTLLEDQCLCDAWKEVSIDPVTGANQPSGAYWGLIKKEFDERTGAKRRWAPAGG
jgi:hypothetical protein